MPNRTGGYHVVRYDQLDADLIVVKQNGATGVTCGMRFSPDLIKTVNAHETAKMFPRLDCAFVMDNHGSVIGCR